MNMHNTLPDAFIDDDGKLMIPINKIIVNPENPRAPVETKMADPDFKILVENIRNTAGVMNHTAIQVYLQDGKYQLIAGHRRLAAVIKANEMEIETWQSTKSGKEPLKLTHIYGSMMGAPKDEFEKGQMMFSAEETSKRWGDVRKFNFFRKMVNTMPSVIRQNPVRVYEKMRVATGMPPSTVKTYCSFIQNETLANAMASHLDEIPKAGRMKMLRACDRGVNHLTQHRPSLVKQVTKQTSADSEKAQNSLAKLFISKLQNYQRLRKHEKLSVGPGVAMERTITEFKNETEGDITDLDIAIWFQNLDNIFRQGVIEQTNRNNQTSDSKAFAYVKSLEIPKITSSLSVEELQSLADDYANCGDYFDDMAKKFRKAVQKRNDS